MKYSIYYEMKTIKQHTCENELWIKKSQQNKNENTKQKTFGGISITYYMSMFASH